MGINIAALQGKSAEELLAIISTMSMAKPTKLTMKVSEKGALSIYGFGRWPVTLYKSQMAKLLAHKDEIEAFMVANDHLLTTKD